jgi:hypothetical protein
MFNLTIKPAQTELIARPGATITQAYTITNNSPESVTLTSDVLPWIPSGTDGSVSYQQTKNNPFIQFSLNNSDLALGQQFTLLPGQNRQLVLKIKSVTDIPVADSYYTFFISQNFSNAITSQNQSSASGRIGSHLLLSFSNSENVNPKLSIHNLSITPRFKDIFFSTININGQIRNDSPHYHQPSGKITIIKNNLIIKEQDIFPQNVLGNSSRDIICLKDNQPSACTFSPPFWPGQYIINIQVDSASTTSSFFVFPYAAIITCFILLTLLLIRRKFIHRHET